jgi:DNA processing protein
MTELSKPLLSALSLFDSNLRLEHFRGRPYQPHLFDLDRARGVLEWCEKRGVHVLHPESPSYPDAFYHLEKPPLFLSVEGPIKALVESQPRLAVVGTREPTTRSLEWLDHHISEFLRKRAAVIVSGGARGIDQKAHRIAIREGAPTFVFLPSGLARAYPAEIEGWREALFESGGVLISQYAPEQEIRRRHFEARNRLIAAMGQVVLIAEARRKSGSVMTARLASELGKTLAVLPSFPGEASSSGTLDLLFNGAFPLRDSDDLLTLFDSSV